MASLSDIYSLLIGAPQLRQRFLAARVQVSWNILNEDAGTSNHANRLYWARTVLNDNEAHSQSEYARFLSNATIQSSGNSSSDNDIQFVVNGMVNSWADDLRNS